MQLPLKFWLPSGGILLYLLTCQPTAAQIIPDSTLLNNSVVPPDCINCEITGGTTAGNNLFHSFEQFTIPTSGSANFNNAATIENIISRVTGNLPSEIDGLISANDTANVFLINPNGIIFGAEAALNIGGSFLATTADSINFADGTQFSAVNPQSTPLLTVSLPVGLQFGQTPGEISNQSFAPLVDFSTGELIVDEQGVPFPGGLQVTIGRTLALVGGQVTIPGGLMTVPGGRIELGSVAGNNLVSLTPLDQGWALGYDGIQNFQDIYLSQAAFVDVSSASGGGDIQIQGKIVTLTEGSQVFNIALAEGQAGSLRVKASESVELLGTPTDSFSTGLVNDVEGDATGEGGSLTIETGKLIVQGGAQISTSTSGTGRGVDLRINALDSVELLGISPSFNQPSGLFTRSNELAIGNAGSLTIETGRLVVRDGAQVSTDTSGAGRAGDLRVRATDIELAGRTPDNLAASGLSAQTNEGAIGDSGNLIIETERLVVLGGAQVSNAGRGSGQQGTLTIDASDSILLSGTVPIQRFDNTSGVFVSAEPGATGNAGQLNINTEILTVEDGARISADNFGSGEVGGNATLNVRQLTIQNGGQVKAGSYGTGAGGILNVNASESVEITSNGTLFTQAEAAGDAGDLNITTRNLSVRDGGNVTVSSTGSGAAGELKISARSVELDSNASLTATTNSGNGGNIRLQADDLLLLRRNSTISTRAGTPATGGGSGGIVTIDTDNLVALENSDIDANAFGGAGGQVRISAQGIFGTQVREQQTPESDITASSDLGSDFSGTVEIITPDIDPSQGLVDLSVETVDASNQIAAGCTNDPNASQNKFTITGRGGLPLNPGDALSGDAVLTDWATLRETEVENISSRATTTSVDQNLPTQQIVEAQGWIVDAKGKVFLTAQSPDVTPNSTKLNTSSCNGS